jgi:TNF receptor-associated factor 4
MEGHIEKNIKDHLALTSDRLFSLQDEHEKLKKNLAAIVSCTNKFIWKIDHFDENLNKAKESVEKHVLYSDPFYTEKYGYKLRVILYPNGHRDEYAGHVSIYIQILRGEYDAVLTWPFARKITFTLLDQKENLQQRKNVQMKLSYKGMLDKPQNYKRPTTDTNAGPGYGKFISHEELMTENYIVEDSIFVQVEVGEEYTSTE